VNCYTDVLGMCSTEHYVLWGVVSLMSGAAVLHWCGLVSFHTCFHDSL